MATFWTGYSLTDFLFHDLNITKPGEFAGVFVSLVAVSISFEGIRTLRDFLYGRFLASAKGSRTRKEQRSKSNSPPLVRYSKTNGNPEDEAENERLTGNDNIRGAGDVPGSSAPLSYTAMQREEEDDVLINGEDTSDSRTRPTGIGSSTFPTVHAVSYRRRRELLDLTTSSILHMIYVTVGYILMLAVMTFNTYLLIAVTGGLALGFYFFGPIRNCREFSVFKCFEDGDPSQEQLLPSQDQSKTVSPPDTSRRLTISPDSSQRGLRNLDNGDKSIDYIKFYGSIVQTSGV